MIIPETGCFKKQINQSKKHMAPTKKELHILWVGKFDFRKQLNIALETVAQLKHLENLHLSICGTGNEKQNLHYKQVATKLGITQQVTWHGNLNNAQVLDLMKALIYFSLQALVKTHQPLY